MGAPESLIAVADAGPLIHLAEIDALQLLTVFDKLYIVQQFVLSNAVAHLQRGECEALLVCERLGASIILTDDLAARTAAKLRGFTPVGSLGVAVRNFKLGRISLQEAEGHLVSLQDRSSLFVTRAIIEIAIRKLTN